MSTSNTPSTIISEALATFSRSANLALSTAASEEATRANARIQELRKERDEAIQKAYDAELEIERWKASLAKAELTISHQTETIAELNREVQQWRDQTQLWQNQCHNLSETSRGEVQDWKEQFLHAERERVKLMDRLDDIIRSQELATQRPPRTPHPRTPNPKTLYPTPHIDGGLPSTSRRVSMPQSAPTSSSESTLARGSPHESIATRPRTAKANTPGRRRTEIASVSIPTTNGSAKQKASTQAPSTIRPPRARQETQPLPLSAAHQHSQPPPAQRTHVIRRVQAVVEIPIKEEDDDEESRPSTSGSAPAAEPSASTSGRRPGRSTAGLPARRASQHHGMYQESGEESDYDDLGGDDDGDADYREDDDDELMLGGDDNDQEVYGAARPAEDDLEPRPMQGRKRRMSTAMRNSDASRSGARRRRR
ncbi:hypothetical protein GLOTRDRAFT_139144 [Gloeophyllum trabeum ATCC 11539]|uniref:Uncharacterized protein n=1 Tax=Gloeophyllum trabeum (strain ATCC 11539 / FP-39264 / Madison 617) TaxID=670483 RepID=S7Q3N3_GLOTA|nr:uncharacterized protein GLOTRDRAFT_139144 [Gloeophyllum trabeum ATCC 11539]EPQ54596.1 hypothetical protein GLOTRDRAFT_139144 [Gloeophyllum trabeum ATCC 11539]